MIYFVRHGQTVNNLKHIFYGQDAGPALTATGIAQATATAAALRDIHFDVCYCSPRLRTMQTAQIILQTHPATPLITEPRLVERNWGTATGLPTTVCEPHRWHRYRQFPYVGIETVDQMQDRLYEFYANLNPQQNVLIVSHSGCYRITEALFRGLPASQELNTNKIPNGGYATFTGTPHRF